MTDENYSSTNVKSDRGPYVVVRNACPMLIQDLCKVEIDSYPHSFNGRKFKTVCIYGFVTPVNAGKHYFVKSDNVRFYRIDDGTGHIVFRYNHGSKLESLSASTLSLETNLWTASEDKNLDPKHLESLRTLLTVIKERNNVTQDFFRVGKMCIIGKLCKSRFNELQIKAFNLMEDKAPNRGFEVKFKELLIWYYGQIFEI